MREERKHLQGKRIKIYTRSFSLELYQYARGLFEIEGIPIVRLTDQSADGYFYTILKDTSCDIAINIDEDAFVIDPGSILELTEYMLAHGYANCGLSDGDVNVRGQNPIITNPFFNILDLEKIREQLVSIDEIKRFDYETVKQEMIDQFYSQPYRTLSRYNFDCADYEPYYPFFFWLAYHFRTLYLSSSKHEDGRTTILLSHDRKEILAHSWLSRFYKSNPLLSKYYKIDSIQNTQRINALIDEVYQRRGLKRPVFTQSDRLAFFIDSLIRRMIKVPQRIGGWPRKWKKWYKRYKRKSAKK